MSYLKHEVFLLMFTSTVHTAALMLIASSFFYFNLTWAADHIQIRSTIIESQLTQLDMPSVLMIGDSIIESLYVESTRECPIINAGLGGGGIRDVISLLSKLKDKKINVKFSGVVIAIGVNDARRRELPRNYPMSWRKYYEEMIDIATELHPIVAVSTILPVESGMPLGEIYFDKNLINDFNKIIRDVAKRKNIRLIDSHHVFGAIYKNYPFTIDGVHLLPSSYKVLKKELFMGMPDACRLATVRKSPAASATKH